MTAHDPLCLHTTLHMDSGEPQRVVINCQCPLIARVRADEREKIAAAIEHTKPKMKSDEYLLISVEQAARIARRGGSNRD